MSFIFIDIRGFEQRPIAELEAVLRKGGNVATRRQNSEYARVKTNYPQVTALAAI